jgi:hypothetical protein
MQRWGPWVDEAVLLLDGDGTFRHWKYAGAYAEQPFLDIAIYRQVQARWNELTNEKMERAAKNAKGRRHRR